MLLSLDSSGKNLRRDVSDNSLGQFSIFSGKNPHASVTVSRRSKLAKLHSPKRVEKEQTEGNETPE